MSVLSHVACYEELFSIQRLCTQSDFRLVVCTFPGSHCCARLTWCCVSTRLFVTRHAGKSMVRAYDHLPKINNVVQHCSALVTNGANYASTIASHILANLGGCYTDLARCTVSYRFLKQKLIMRDIMLTRPVTLFTPCSSTVSRDTNSCIATL